MTLLFGLLENGNTWKDKIDTLLDGWQLDSVTIKDVTAFDLGDRYAIVGLIAKTPELIDGHERLTLLPHLQAFSEYTPHLTMAYVEHDHAIADKWVKALRSEYRGATLAAMGINYGDKPTATKSFIRKRTKTVGDVVYVLCNCCEGAGNHDAGVNCSRCADDGWCTPTQDKLPIPCTECKSKSLAGVKKT